jgi:uncharacterized protein with GYD domain
MVDPARDDQVKEQIKKNLAAFHEISFTNVFGQYDYLIDFEANDLDEVDKKIIEIRRLLKDGITQTITLFKVHEQSVSRFLQVHNYQG